MMGFRNHFTLSPCHLVTLSVPLIFLFTSLSGAHPVARRQHDRTIVVRVTADAIVVDYRLEVDEFTAVFEDLPAIDDKLNLSKLANSDEFYEAFSRGYAPILADNLLATLDRKP